MYIFYGPSVIDNNQYFKSSQNQARLWWLANCQAKVKTWRLTSKRFLKSWFFLLSFQCSWHLLSWFAWKLVNLGHKVSNKYETYKVPHSYNSSSFSECNCNPDGSITLECNAKGICTCKVGFTGSKCDECKPNIIGDTCKKCRPNYFNYPLCQGISKLR